MAPPKKNRNKLWSRHYRNKLLAPQREKDRLRMAEVYKKKKEQAAEDESGPPVTKKARVEGVDGTGKEPTETNAANTTGRKRKTATKSDKPAEVRTTRRTRAKVEPHNRNEASKDETTNDKENKDTEADSNGTFDPTSVDPPTDEGRTSRRRNKKTKEPAVNKALTQTLEPDLSKDTDDIVVIAVGKASTPINLATGTESEGKISTEDTSTAQGHMDVEVEPQVIQSVSAISCLANQPLIVNMLYINENHVNQGGSGNSVFAPNTQSGPSTSNENVFFGVEPTMRSQEYPGFGAIQQGYGASGSYEQAGGGAAINNIYQSGVKNSLNAPNSISGLSTSSKASFSSTDSVDTINNECSAAQQVTVGTYEQHVKWIAQDEDQIDIAQEDACYTDETQFQTSHEEHGIEPIQGQLSDDTSTNTTQETSVSATARTCTSDTTATETQDAGTIQSQF